MGLAQLALFVGLVCVSSAAAAIQQSDGRLAEVVGVWGRSEYRPAEIRDWRPAQIGVGLFLDNLVRTGDLSRAAILLRDETQMFLNQNSQIQIREVRSRARIGDRPDERSWTRLRLDIGRVWSQSRRVQRTLSMETPTVTMGIRGTDWEVEVDGSGKTTLTVLSGEVDFFNDLGRLTVARGEQAVAERGKPPVKILIANPRERVQWVSAYSVQPLRHVYMRDFRLDRLRAVLTGPGARDADALAAQGDANADLGEWNRARDAYGAALREQPAQARALLGLAYEALWRRRVGDAERFLGRVPAAGIAGADAELVALAQTTLDIFAGRMRDASSRLSRLIESGRTQQPAAWLILSDIRIFEGEFRLAEDLVAAAAQRHPGDDRIPSQLARIRLLAGDGDAAAAATSAGVKMRSESLEAAIVSGDIARFRGDARAASDAYGRATTLKPADDRGWYGLGVVASEREDLAQARRALDRAISLNPAGPGYRGELATLETFANRFGAASAGYDEALRANPSDSLALTGLGLLQLKRGATEDALDSLLRASVIEPRYARVHVFIAVAYYQLRQTSAALNELARASELDPNDPLPYQLASVIRADHLEPAQSIEASRQAMARLPYLKSLNQVANDQKGTANLGSALALFGLEDWAQSYAQNSYYPYWGGSHLFLSDRYTGEFNKKSELYQGYITDPLAFGASNRFQTLFPRPGHYLSGFLNGGRDAGSQYGLWRGVANGFSNAVVPTAYFVEYDGYRQVPRSALDRVDVNLGQGLAALGMEPTENFGLFVFGKALDWPVRTTAGTAALGTGDSMDRHRRADAGGRVRFGHASQLWFKAGAAHESEALSGNIPFTAASLPGQFVRFDSARDKNDASLRFTYALSDATEFSLGAEWARDDYPLHATLLDPAFLYGQGNYFDDRRQDESKEAYLSLRARVSDRLTLQGDLFLQDYSRSVSQVFGDVVGGVRTPQLAPPDVSAEKSALRPRLGLAIRPFSGQQLRAVHQRWTRSAALATLGPVSTAGVPLDDWIAEPGGDVLRNAVQLESEWSSRTFTQLSWDRKRIANFRVEGGLGTLPRFQTITAPDIERLRNQGLFGAVVMDTPEGQPIFESGELTQIGAALNQVVSERMTAYLRIRHSSSENTGAQYRGNPLPYVPRRQTTLGATWAGPNRFYLSGQAVYRSSRYKYDDLTGFLDAGWTTAFKLYWETADKALSASATVERSADVSLGTTYRFGLGYRM